jgi:hypothetical protein
MRWGLQALLVKMWLARHRGKDFPSRKRYAQHLPTDVARSGCHQRGASTGPRSDPVVTG